MSKPRSIILLFVCLIAASIFAYAQYFIDRGDKKMLESRLNYIEELRSKPLLFSTGPSEYTQSYLLETVILPAMENYPEIRWFADEEVAATQEAKATESIQSWTNALISKGLIPESSKKYIELERMLQSLICLHLLSEGTEAAYYYWIQAQEKDGALSFSNFQKLHLMLKEVAPTKEQYKALEASLVYSDLGKTPEAKKRASSHGLTQTDHDDLMAAIYSSPMEIRESIIPSFAKLDKELQVSILSLHLAVPLHWGHAIHLEGGAGMFTALLAQNPTKSYIKQAFLIQVCDVGAAAAHVNFKGALAFNETTYLGYDIVFNVVNELIHSKDSEAALHRLYTERAKLLGYENVLTSNKQLLLTRMATFLRICTPIGNMLDKVSNTLWKPSDWALMHRMFGAKTGVNSWKRNPTYMPAVLLNLYNTLPKEASVEARLECALQGALVMAKIADKYEALAYSNSENPLCFNALAGQARSNPSLFTKDFNAENISWESLENPVIKTTPKLGSYLKLGM